MLLLGGTWMGVHLHNDRPPASFFPPPAHSGEFPQLIGFRPANQKAESQSSFRKEKRPFEKHGYTLQTHACTWPRGLRETSERAGKRLWRRDLGGINLHSDRPQLLPKEKFAPFIGSQPANQKPGSQSSFRKGRKERSRSAVTRKQKHVARQPERKERASESAPLEAGLICITNAPPLSSQAAGINKGRTRVCARPGPLGVGATGGEAGRAVGESEWTPPLPGPGRPFQAPACARPARGCGCPRASAP